MQQGNLLPVIQPCIPDVHCMRMVTKARKHVGVLACPESSDRQAVSLAILQCDSEHVDDSLERRQRPLQTGTMTVNQSPMHEARATDTEQSISLVEPATLKRKSSHLAALIQV